VFNHLGIDPLRIDLGERWPPDSSFDSVLICTPTKSHIDDIVIASRTGLPILCEKPIATNLDDVLTLCDWVEKEGVNLSMVNQYRQLGPFHEGWSYYNYWNTGKDGLAWDCISILALAKGRAVLGNDAAIWTCAINGRNLNLAEMDIAYIRMIKEWLAFGKTAEDVNYIREAHKKAAAYDELENRPLDPSGKPYEELFRGEAV